MKPIEFITDVDQYNSPMGDEMVARVKKELIICDKKHTYTVLSYYWTKDGMILEIEKQK